MIIRMGDDMQARDLSVNTRVDNNDNNNFNDDKY